MTATSSSAAACSRPRGYLLVLSAACLWALIGPVAKVAMAAGMHPLEISFYRTLLAWVLFSVHAMAIGKTCLERRDIPVILGFGLCGIAGLFGAYMVAVQLGGAALASVLLYTAPAWVAVLSGPLLGESMTRLKLLAVGLTVLGVAGVSLGPGSGQLHVGPAAIFMGLLSGLAYALYYVFGKRYLGRYETPTLFLYSMPVGLAAMAGFFHFGGHPPQAWVAVGVLAVCCTYLAYTVYYAGLRHLEATRAAVVATLEPLVASLLAFIWWDERFGLLGYLGAVLILGAVLVTIAEDRGVAPEPTAVLPAPGDSDHCG